MKPATILRNLQDIPPEWLSYPETARLFSAIHEAGGECRFVGGCVRDALLGILSDDLDICTNMRPEAVLDCLGKAGFRVIPTGMSHGTVTAVLNKRVFEVTTLRVDVETDGRHADVSFTQSWQEDAARRDFTFNALFLEQDGRLYDFFSGLQDLERGIVRFIGEPAERIQEDYLRILRYFRFLARFGQSVQCPSAEEAIVLNKGGLAQLSAERISKELLLLLKVPNPMAAVEMMDRLGIFEVLFERDVSVSLLSSMIMLDFQSDEINRLSGLLKGDDQYARQVARELRLSSRAENRLIRSCEDRLKPSLNRQEQKKTLYFVGKQTFEDRVLLSWAREPAAVAYADYLKLAEEWLIPEFPVSGKDLIDRGIQPGPEMGAQLKKMENQWVDSDFKLDWEALLGQL
ncbi:MAG: CCA tRNA nucleotidyltransferase [Sneathiella sp.]